MSFAVIDVDYEQPLAAGDGSQSCDTRHAWARVPPEPGPAEREALKARIRRLLRERNAVMVSHYYVHPDLRTWRRRPAAW
jgi:quinolinate synthase